MRNPTIATLATLTALFLATACTATTSGGQIPSGDEADAAPPPKKSLTSAEAGTPPAIEEEPLKCGGFAFNDKACGICGASKCCAVAALCMDDKECRALSACASSCSGDATCVERCANLHSAGISKYNAIGTCAETKCATECVTTPPPPPPASKGIGDRCTSSSDCRDGYCNGTAGEPGWCTTSCSQNYDCVGYPQINNQYGKLNYCLQTSAGSNLCFPGCSTTSDCTKYASNLTCQSAGNGVYVCSL